MFGMRGVGDRDVLVLFFRRSFSLFRRIMGSRVSFLVLGRRRVCVYEGFIYCRG